MNRAPLVSVGVVLVAGLSALRAEAHERFRYVDRDGRVHTVSVDADGTAVAPPPAALAPIVVDTDAPNAPDASGVPYLVYARGAAEFFSLPLPLIVAVMKVESGFNPRAVSPKGAMGLMQLMPATASDMGVTDPFDPRQSIYGGARFLRLLMDEFEGDLARVLAAYHAGAARIHRSGGAIPFDVTRRYVSSVLRTYGDYIVSGVGEPPPAQVVASGARGGR